MNKEQRKKEFFSRYNVLLETEKDFCFVCTNEIVKIMNEKYAEKYMEEEVNEWLYKDWEQTDQELLFENLGINL